MAPTTSHFPLSSAVKVSRARATQTRRSTHIVSDHMQSRFSTLFPQLRTLSICVLTACAIAMTGSHSANAKRDDTEPAAKDFVSGTGVKRKAIPRSDTRAQAVNAAVRGDYARAFRQARESGSRVALRTVEWLYLRQKPTEAGYSRIMKFVRAHSHWPSLNVLKGHAERLMLDESFPTSAIEAHFKQYKQASPYGDIALGRLMLAKGDRKQAQRFIRSAWHNLKLTADGEQAILSRYSGLIGKWDHRHRMWRLIYAHKTRDAIRVGGRISGSYKTAATVARDLIKRRKGALSRYNRLHASFRSHITMRYAAVRYHRKRGDRAKARALLAAAPFDPKKLIDPAPWATERRIVARHLLSNANRKYWPLAYKFAARNGLSSGNAYVDIEAFAAWIALRRLNKPKTALKHLDGLALKTSSRVLRSRVHYWTARAYQALGDRKKAVKAYKAAAAYPTFFYGQLAREALGKNAAIHLSPVKVAKADRDRVARDDLVAAFKLMGRAHGDKHMGRMLRAILRRFETSAQHAAAFDVIKRHGGTALAVRYAKYAGLAGRPIEYRSHPYRVLPKYRSLRNPVEHAVVYAITRQESEFRHTAQSWAGAKGYMQIMPRTGKLMARKYRLRGHSTRRLTSDPKYNVMLGATLLGDLMKQFDGSYIMTFIGYNAGPGRAIRWAKAYGDPRSSRVDPVDWIESIPITETRMYVKKVMSNVHIYRTRFAPHTIRPMTVDLNRGGASIKPTAAAGRKSNACGGRNATIASLVRDC